MFREIREIKNKEIRNDKKDEPKNGYLNIKPETDMTVEEANDFWKRCLCLELKSKKYWLV